MASQDCATGAGAGAGAGASSSLLRPVKEEEWQKTVTLTSSDGEVFEVEVAAARRSVLVLHMMELGVAWDGIKLPTLSGDILTLAVAYLKAHREDSDGDHKTTALKNLDDDLVMQLDQATLIKLLSAANYLEIEGLLNLTCQTVANMIKGKTIEEIRQTFHIKNDYTPEEEEEVRNEISWALD